MTVQPAKRSWNALTEDEEYAALVRSRLTHLVPVREPLVLVSQIQRSGGTLLSQLFDGHPACHAHPKELKWGYPRKRDWPVLDLSAPETWFPMLYEKRLEIDLVHGYVKAVRHDLDHDRFPFLFPVGLQKRLFDACVATREIRSERDVLDCYLTAYFNAWLDNHNLYTGPKRVVTGFVPLLASELANVERMFAAYPDGRLIGIVRDPGGWYASALHHKPDRYGDVEKALALWRASAEASLAAHARWREQVDVIVYERLVDDTAAVMSALADRIGIAMAPVLLTPTFNGRPIRADSSFAVERHGVLRDRTQRYREHLDDATIERVRQLAGDVYDRAAAVSL